MLEIKFKQLLNVAEHKRGVYKFTSRNFKCINHGGNEHFGLLD